MKTVTIADVKIHHIVIYPQGESYFIHVSYALVDSDGNEVAQKLERIEKQHVAAFAITDDKEHIASFQSSVKEHLLTKEAI